MNETSPLHPIAYQDRHSLIQERLKQYIVANRLRAGDRMPPEEVLADQLGVSRTALREALRGLEALGIIAAQQGVGRVVLPFSFQPILDNLSYGFAFNNHSILRVTEIRKALDAYFTPAAIEDLTEEDFSTLEALVERMQEHTDAGQEMEREDYSFHQLLYQRCGNPLALQLFEITWQVRLAALDQARALYETPPGTSGEHRALLEALRMRDVERTRSLVVGHHWNIEERFRRLQETGSEQLASDPGDPPDAKA